MTELLTAAGMRALEQAAMDSGRATGLELMERAGRGVVAAVLEHWPELATTAHRAVVLCGPGNNGGDGFVVARLLRERGWTVDLWFYGAVGKLPPDARTNHDRWAAMGAVRPWDDRAIGDRLDDPLADDLVVDALFGTGLTRGLPEDMALTAQGVLPGAFVPGPPGQGPRYVAVDLPSGIDSDSGVNLGRAMPAQLTVTFHRPRLGHYLDPGQGPGGGMSWCGTVKVVDIGLGDAPLPDAVRLVEGLPEGFGKHAGHKYAHGHALVLGGGPGRGGAARLSARAALRIGAGLVTLAPPAEALTENAARLDAVMLREVDGAAGLAAVLEDRRINALCLGPGLGVDRAAELVPVVLGDGGVNPRPTVLDADALTALGVDAAAFGRLHDGCVLTPHGGEFARLFSDIADRLAAPATRGPAFSKVDAAREAAARAGCVVLLKGPDTVIAHPDGRARISAAAYGRAAPWLATAGAGDVLAGMIAGLLARGFPPFEAACAAAWLHVEAALSFGPGLIAEDLPDELPKVFRQLGA